MTIELTPEQISKFPEYTNIWTAKGLTTTQKSLEDAIIDFTNFQKVILKKDNPTPVVILESPLHCWIAVQMVKSLFGKTRDKVWFQVREQIINQVESQLQSQVATQVRNQVVSNVSSQVHSQVKSQVASQIQDQVMSQVQSQVESQVWSQVESQVWSQVDSQVESQVKSQVESQVSDQVWSQVRNQVRNQVREQIITQVESQLHSQVRDKIKSQVRNEIWFQVWDKVSSQVESQVRNRVKSQAKSEITNFIWPYFDCQFWAGWVVYYEFMKNEVGVKYPNDKEYEAFKSCQPYGMVFPLDELCIVCQPPTRISMKNGLLHNEHEAAVSYNGHCEVYALNGVRMMEEYVMTPANEISSETIMRELNVEMRRELLRKVGIERVMESLPHKLLEKKGNYELYSIDLSNDLKDTRYLKMINPSISVYHLEGVAPEINSISEALKWRNNNLFENAEILT